jgi:hypothetical protein
LWLFAARCRRLVADFEVLHGQFNTTSALDALRSFPALAACADALLRADCVAHTHPVFSDDEDCERWTCASYSSPLVPAFPCCMPAMEVDAALRLLDGADVVFVGDSTARRMGIQLRAFLTRSSFADQPVHSTVTGRVTTSSTATTVSSVWLPWADTVRDAFRDVAAATNTSSGETRSLQTVMASPARKVVVLFVSTHDLQGALQGAALSFDAVASHLAAWAERWVPRVVAAVAAVQSAVTPDRDIVVVRLPIAQNCTMPHCNNYCNDSARVDAVNDALDAVSSMLSQSLAAAHPDVARIPVSVWTREPAAQYTGAGRHRCVRSDGGGTHIADDVPRIALMQQVRGVMSLRSAETMSADAVCRCLRCGGVVCCAGAACCRAAVAGSHGVAGVAVDARDGVRGCCCGAVRYSVPRGAYHVVGVRNVALGECGPLLLVCCCAVVVCWPIVAGTTLPL